MEYLLIVAFAFLLLTAITYVALVHSASFTGEVTAAQIQKTGNKIIDAADAVYFSGPPAKKTISLYFPKNIQSIDIEGKALVFTVSGNGGDYEYALSSASNLTGSLRTFSGIHRVTVEANDTNVIITDN